MINETHAHASQRASSSVCSLDALLVTAAQSGTQQTISPAPPSSAAIMASTSSGSVTYSVTILNGISAVKMRCREFVGMKQKLTVNQRARGALG